MPGGIEVSSGDGPADEVATIMREAQRVCALDGTTYLVCSPSLFEVMYRVQPVGPATSSFIDVCRISA